MLDRKEIDIEIARLEYGESSYPAYAKLADLYTIRNQMEGINEQRPAAYSTAAASEILPAPIYADSDFLMAAADRDPEQVWQIIDDLMDTLSVTNPRAYKSVMRRIRELPTK